MCIRDRVYRERDTEGFWGDTGAPAGGYIGGHDLSFESVVLMCRLYLSRRGRRRKEEGGGADLSLKSNNPTLKGGELVRMLRFLLYGSWEALDSLNTCMFDVGRFLNIGQSILITGYCCIF